MAKYIADIFGDWSDFYIGHMLLFADVLALVCIHALFVVDFFSVYIFV